MDASTAVLSGPITLNPIKMAWEYEEQESGASQSLTTRPYSNYSTLQSAPRLLYLLDDGICIPDAV